MPDPLNIALFIIFEFIIFFSSVRIFYILTKFYNKEISIQENIIAWISIGIILNGILATIFSFVQYNGILQYLVSSSFILVLLHLNLKNELISYKKYLQFTFGQVSENFFDWRIIITLVALSPVLLFSIRPTQTVDNLFMLNFLFEWIFNQQTPLVRAWNYVPFWELSYIPSMIITKTDNYFWTISFLPLLITILGVYQIGKSLKIPKNLLWLTIFSSLLFFKIWFIGNTIAELKNDMILASGLILIVYSFCRSFKYGFDRISFFFLIFGIIFATIKFSGIAIAIFALGIFVIIHRKKILNNKKLMIAGMAVLTLMFFSTTGVYYLSNFLEYGNPVYPIKISVLGNEFPGNMDLSETSIVSNLDHPEVFGYFFPKTGLSIGGIFFPIILLFGSVGLISIIIISIVKKNVFEDNKLLLVISSLVFVSWILYVFSPYSAGNGPDNLKFLESLKSIRYAIAPIFITELLFVFILWKSKIPIKIIYGLIGIFILSRYYIISSLFPTTFDHVLLVGPILILIGVYIYKKSSKQKKFKISLPLLIVVLIFILAPFVVESNRSFWVPPFHNVAMYLYNEPPTTIYLIQEPGPSDKNFSTYPFYGNHFQHNLTKGSSQNLIEILEFDFNTPPKYIVKLCNPEFNCKMELEKFSELVSSYGYKTLIIDKLAILLRTE